MDSSPDLSLAAAVRRIGHGQPLSQDEAAAAFGVVVRGEGSPALTAALLMGLRVRGETADEVAGAVAALRAAMLPVETPLRERLVDTCGTGGGTVTTLNISTAAAFVAAGAGVPIAKHGNRSFTSRTGSADVLEALGVDVGLAPERIPPVLAEAGFAFLFAPVYHPAMRHVGPTRRELGIPTVMNLLGPMLNPAGARRQVVGAADAARAELIAHAMTRLGTVHALVVHGDVGMDEISPAGTTSVWEVCGTAIERWTLDPRDHGLDCTELDALAGGEPAENAERIEALLAGDGARAVRCAVLLNAAAALYVSGRGWSFDEAAARAADALASGAAANVLARVRAVAPRAG